MLTADRGSLLQQTHSLQLASSPLAPFNPSPRTPLFSPLSPQDGSTRVYVRTFVYLLGQELLWYAEEPPRKSATAAAAASCIATGG